MNYKLLFPTFRNRFRFVETQLQNLPQNDMAKALNLGTGEGDYDPLISQYCKELISCDINERDIAFAKSWNQHLTNVTYQIEDALALTFPDDYFDLIISVEVLEHVGQPDVMMQEVSRVLKPGGIAILTFPRYEFPVTYDPINRWFRKDQKRLIAQGAYAFGHEYLIKVPELKEWAQRQGLAVVHEENLSGALVGLLEAYWTGMVQRLFKDNATNLSEDEVKKITLRPTQKVPALVAVTDAILNMDRAWFGRAKRSIGKGMVFQKLNP